MLQHFKSQDRIAWTTAKSNVLRLGTYMGMMPGVKSKQMVVAKPDNGRANVYISPEKVKLVTEEVMLAYRTQEVAL